MPPKQQKQTVSYEDLIAQGATPSGQAEKPAPAAPENPLLRKPKSLAVQAADLVRPELSSEYPNLSAAGQVGADLFGGVVGMGDATMKLPGQLYDLGKGAVTAPGETLKAVGKAVWENPFTTASAFAPGGSAMRMSAGLAGGAHDATNQDKEPADVWANALNTGVGNVAIEQLLKGVKPVAANVASAVTPAPVRAAVTGAKNMAGQAGKEVLSSLSGVAESSIGRRIADNAGVKAAVKAGKATKDVAEKISADLENLRVGAGQRVEGAKAALRKLLGVTDDTPVDMAKLTASVEQRLNDMKLGLKTSRVRNAADETAMLDFWYKMNDPAFQTYDGLQALIEEAKTNMKVYQGGAIKTDKAASFFNEMYRELGKLDDATVPGIQAIKSQAAEQIGLFNRLERYFPSKRKQAPNTGERTLNNLDGDGAKAVTREDLEQLAQITGKDYADEIANAIAARDFTMKRKITEIPRGVQALLVSGGLGAAGIGGAMGGGLGALAGLAAAPALYAASRPGNLGALIDTYVKMPKSPLLTGAGNATLAQGRVEKR